MWKHLKLLFGQCVIITVNFTHKYKNERKLEGKNSSKVIPSLSFRIRFRWRRTIYDLWNRRAHTRQKAHRHLTTENNEMIPSLRQRPRRSKGNRTLIKFWKPICLFYPFSQVNQSLVLKVSCKLENLLFSYKTSNNFGCH